MKTKARIAGLLAGITALTSMGCAGYVPKPVVPLRSEREMVLADAESKSLPLERMLERELRKHGDWISDYVEQDYANEEREGFAALRIYPKERIEQDAESGVLGFYGRYDPETDTYEIPEPAGEEFEEVMDAVDHELWHSIYDDHGRKGIIYQEGYSGPSPDEIKEYCLKKIQGKEFDHAREVLDKFKKANQASTYVISAEEMYRGMFEKALDIFNSSEKYVSTRIAIMGVLERMNQGRGFDIRKYVDSLDKESMKERRVNLADILERMMDDLRDLEVMADEGFRTVEDEYVRPEVVNDFLESIRDNLENLARYDTVVDDASGLREEVWNTLDRAEDRLFRDIEHYLKESMGSERDPEKKGILGSKLQNYMDLKARIDSTRISRGILGRAEIDEHGREQLERLYDRMNTYRENIYMIDTILTNPDEIMARTYDGVSSMYFGPVTSDKFPATEEDLGFLERFTYKGKPMFIKIVEKNRLGREMIEDGYSPEEVKGMLEYATEFTYKGKKYSWPEADVKIKGSIPVLETSDDY